MMFADLSPGLKLKARDEVSVRAQPASPSQLVSILAGGDCVLIAGEPIRNEAANNPGGWVPIKRSECS
jgi:hypothetical protein